MVKVSPRCVELTQELDREYFDLYDGERSYEDSFLDYFDAGYIIDLIEVVWGNKPPYKLLDVGSANGLTLREFSRVGVEAWGVENNVYMHSKTHSKWKSRNLFGNICSLPFEDNSFDFAYETCLCYVDEKQIDKAISELHRVVKKGIIFGSITSDMTKEVIEKHDIFYAVKTLCTTWEWSEKFLRNGFRLSIMDSKVLSQIWKFETDGDDDEDLWYPNQETMRYCFFTKV